MMKQLLLMAFAVSTVLTMSGPPRSHGSPGVMYSEKKISSYAEPFSYVCAPEPVAITDVVLIPGVAMLPFVAQLEHRSTPTIDPGLSS